MKADRPWRMLIAGPYLYGTDGDPARIAGASRGAGLDLARAQALGPPVFHRVEDLPVAH